MLLHFNSVLFPPSDIHVYNMDTYYVCVCVNGRGRALSSFNGERTDGTFWAVARSAQSTLLALSEGRKAERGTILGFGLGSSRHKSRKAASARRVQSKR